MSFLKYRVLDEQSLAWPSLPGFFVFPGLWTEALSDELKDSHMGLQDGADPYLRVCICGRSTMVRAPAFQAGDAGSIPVSRSINSPKSGIFICREGFCLAAFQPHQIKAMIHPGQLVDVVLKADQPTGKLTRGVVKQILTNSKTHPRGIKVMLTDRQVGRVQRIVPDEEARPVPSND